MTPKLGKEGGAFAAPKALTEAALGDPDRAAELLLWKANAWVLERLKRPVPPHTASDF